MLLTCSKRNEATPVFTLPCCFKLSIFTATESDVAGWRTLFHFVIENGVLMNVKLCTPMRQTQPVTDCVCVTNLGSRTIYKTQRQQVGQEPARRHRTEHTRYRKSAQTFKHLHLTNEVSLVNNQLPFFIWPVISLKIPFESDTTLRPK